MPHTFEAPAGVGEDREPLGGSDQRWAGKSGPLRKRVCRRNRRLEPSRCAKPVIAEILSFILVGVLLWLGNLVLVLIGVAVILLGGVVNWLVFDVKATEVMLASDIVVLAVLRLLTLPKRFRRAHLTAGITIVLLLLALLVIDRGAAYLRRNFPWLAPLISVISREEQDSLRR